MCQSSLGLSLNLNTLNQFDCLQSANGQCIMAFLSCFCVLLNCRSPDVTIGSDDGDDIFADFPSRTRHVDTFTYTYNLTFTFMPVIAQLQIGSMGCCVLKQICGGSQP